MAGFQKKDPVERIRLLQTSDTIKRSDLISGYVNLMQADPCHPGGQLPDAVRSKINKRLYRDACDAPRISSLSYRLEHRGRLEVVPRDLGNSSNTSNEITRR